ncbi:MAG TPA: HAMP domain-containing sensor histidine kinase [Treponemataceae bacterium]|nr:HAMP domain-containing sensor histidine kinase [Treponemataceae bacterium]
MKIDRSFKILAVLVALALSLAIALAVLFVRQVMERNRAMIEFHVFRVMAGILDEYSGSRSFTPSDWPGLAGFALYDESGSPFMRYGSAPERLPNPGAIPFPGVSDLSGSSMTIIRRTGSGPGPEVPSPTAPEERGFMRGMRPMMGASRAGPSVRMPHMLLKRGGIPGIAAPGGAESGSGEFIKGFVYIDYGVAGMLREGRYALVFVLFFLAAFFSIIFLLVVYARRLVAYRERDRETAQLVQLGEAARTLAHEIKNPLGIIRVQCATLRRTVPEDRARNISVIEEETGRLTLLTDRLRDFISSSAGKPEARPAARYLEECARRYDGSIAVIPYDGPAVSVSIDPSRMMQVLDNLIANAREATAGREATAVSEASAPREAAAELPELSLTVRRNLAVFSVADRGPGISEENRGRVFEPFFTTKARGSGIGLALSRRFMEQAGGTLSFAPRQGGGCAFSASLPCSKE